MKTFSPRNLTILVGSTMTVLAATIISPALPRMAAHFADTPNVDFLVRLTLTMPALFIAVGALFAGTFLDRFGRKPSVGLDRRLGWVIPIGQAEVQPVLGA